MEVVIQLRPTDESPTDRGIPSAAVADVIAALGDLGVDVEPMHPGAVDELLTPWLTVDVDDLHVAEEVITRLEQHDGVDAAYIKPAGEAPS